MLLQLILFILIQYCHVIYSDNLFDSAELNNDIDFTIKISKPNNYTVLSEAWNGLVLYSRATVTTDGKKTGWYKLDTWINPNISNEVTSNSVGWNEGTLLTKVTSQYFHNTMKTFCDKRKKICDKIKYLIKGNTKWVQGMIKKYKNTDPYWWQVHLLYRQFEGIVQGYNDLKAKTDPKLTAEDFLFMNMQEEVYELAEKFSDDKSLSKKLQEGHCSAIIKLLPKNEDLLVAHAAWDGYNTMTRFAKKYDQPFRLLPKSKEIIPGKLITFSSYPSLIHSNDDFYTTSTGLSVMETTIGNYNNKLWKYVTPKGIVFEFIRVMVANRLATDGKSWTKIFSKYNSGTYNNQWMIVDFNKFTPGKSPKKGLLWILEQIPGHIKAEDQTQLLKKQTYWPSYNTPYYKNIFNLSGNDKLVKRYGEWFSYEGAPRAKIFKRDHKKIKCVHTLMELMRSNNFKHDQFSKCKCKPPYSATNAIASRNDLNPKNGSYPFPLLGFRPSGATDAKVTNSTLIKKQYFLAVAGPTTGTNLPIFKWSKCDFRDKVPHLGQPDEWNFQPQLITWI